MVYFASFLQHTLTCLRLKEYCLVDGIPVTGLNSCHFHRMGALSCVPESCLDNKNNNIIG